MSAPDDNDADKDKVQQGEFLFYLVFCYGCSSLHSFLVKEYLDRMGIKH